MENAFTNRKKLRFIKVLTACLLIVLSLSAITAGIFLLNASQKEVVQSVDFGEPVAVLGSFAVTDKQRIVPMLNSALPIIQAATDPLTDGDRVSGQGIEFTTLLLSQLSKKQVAVERITLYTREYSVLHLPGNTDVIYKEKPDPAELASSLQSMLSVFTIEGKKPAEIDFRFDKPVLRY